MATVDGKARAIAVKRFAFWHLVLVILTVGACLSACSSFTEAAEQLTADEIGKLEPEICKEGSFSFRALTGLLPTLAGSSTRNIDPERIALIDQSKASGRRKVWVLNVPAAFITFRTCDSGRKNWVGEGDYLKVSQDYDLDVVLLDDRVIARTRATNEEKNSGVAVHITLKNKVTNPQIRNRIYSERPSVLGRAAVSPITCHEQPADIAGLVVMKRINANVGSPLDCEGGNRKVFAKKADDGKYEFVAKCQVNCSVDRDYEGWLVVYAYSFQQLEKWELIHGRMKKLLDDWTLHIDHDS